MVKTKKIPLRKCVGCQEMKPKKELLRVLRTPEGLVCLDTTGRMNGRGAYLCASTQCLAKARKSKALERGLQTQVSEEAWKALEEEIGRNEE